MHADGQVTPRPTLGRRLLLIWLVTFAVGLVGLDARATYGARVSADEPQYLMTALSLAEDFDLDVSDEIEEELYLPFHEIGLNTQTIDLDDDGQRISPHDPLLPLVLAPAMGLGGWAAAKAMLAAIAGLTAVATAWVAVRRFGITVGTATVGTIALFANPPLTAYATQVYPEMPAALATIIGLGAVLGIQRNPGDGDGRIPVGPVVVAVLAIIALPWLSVKYVPVAGVIGLGLLLRLDRIERRAAVRTTAVLAVSGALYLLLHQRIYGGWTVYAAGDHFVDGEFLVVGSNPDYFGRSRRLAGLLIGRFFGLAPWAPVYLLLPAAVGAFARRGREVILALAVLATGWGVATWIALTMHGWWWPGRQVVVVLPVAVIAMLALVDGRPRRLIAAGALSLLGVVNWWWLAWEASTDRRTIIVDFFETEALPYRILSPIFPDHANYDVIDVVVTVVWTVAILATVVAGWRQATPPSLPDQQPGRDEDRPGEDQEALASAVPEGDLPSR
ncbi:MAG: hypothetical protein AAF547_14185 [Actinomycetota bacterium]